MTTYETSKIRAEAVGKLRARVFTVKSAMSQKTKRLIRQHSLTVILWQSSSPTGKIISQGRKPQSIMKDTLRKFRSEPEEETVLLVDS